MRAKNVAIGIFIIAIVVGLCYVARYGVGKDRVMGISHIKQGLDLKGGVNVVFKADKEDVTKKEMDAAQALIQGRLDRNGETESEVSIQGTDRIRVDVPGYEDAEEASNTIGKTAQLSFVDEQGNVLVKGDQVANAQPGTQTNEKGQSEVVVSLDFTPEGAKLFEKATADNVGKRIIIMLDQDVLSAPSVNQKIAGGKAIISGGFTATQAKELADLINAGSLPFNLEILSIQKVGARLGIDSLYTSINAGILGFAIILLLMLLLYRFSGLAADIALFTYLALQLIFLSIFNVTLTLPGIAGILLSVAMAVDANIIIFERINDELSSGKSLRNSVDSGFKRALPAIIDSNITTIIAGVILYWLGTGPIKGFAQTLTIGILMSMFTAIFVTKLILMTIIKATSSNVKLYSRFRSAKEESLKVIKIISSRKKYFTISIVAIAIGLAFMFYNGATGKGFFNYDVEFTGGTEVTVDMGKEFDSAELRKLIVETTKDNAPQIQKIIGTNSVSIKTVSLDSETRTTLSKALTDKYGVDQKAIELNDISASISKEMQGSAILAVFVSCIGMLLYVTIRFKDVKTGASAVLALVHDTVLVVLSYAVFRIPLSYSFIAAVLTILGFSINATIVVFDRVRENRRTMLRVPFEDIIDKSITQTIMRCIYTSVTVLIMCAGLYFMGVASIKDFMLPIMVGTIWGTYSSIFLSGSFLYVLTTNKKK